MKPHEAQSLESYHPSPVNRCHVSGPREIQSREKTGELLCAIQFLVLDFKHIEMKIQSFVGVSGEGRLGLLPKDVMSEVTSQLGHFSFDSC